MEAIQKHSRMPRKRQAKVAGAPSLRGHAGGSPYPLEFKQEIVDASKGLILDGGMTLAQIAAKYGIAERTLEYWLSDLGEDYEALRKAWLDHMLTEARELMREETDDPLRLARARELWKSATWYAERRDRARYGQDANVNINLHGDLGELLRARLDRSRERLVGEIPASHQPTETITNQESEKQTPQ